MAYRRQKSKGRRQTSDFGENQKGNEAANE